MIDSLHALLQHSGYALLALSCAIEGESAVLLAGVAARHGVLQADRVVATAALATFMIDLGYFLLGRYKGQAILRRMPGGSERHERLQALLARRPAAAVFGLRFAYGVRAIGTAWLGTSPIRGLTYAVCSLLASLAWAALFTALGWSVGDAAKRWVAGAQEALLVALGVLVAAALVVWAVRRWRRRAAGR